MVTSYLLIVEFLNLQRFDDIGDELRVHVCVPNLLVQHLTNSSLELGGDLLGFVGDVQSR